MKHFSRTLVCAVCTLCIVTIARANEQSDMLVDSGKMHEVVRSMLGFSGDPSMPHPSNRAEDLPKYMLDLYDVVKDGVNSPKKMRGNTVRSIKASIGAINGKAMFVFNMTSLTSKHEDIIGAEIHLFKRRKDKYNKKSDIELVLYEIAPHFSKENGKIVVTPEVYGWQWFDVTNVVKTCVSDVIVSDAPRSLGLNFRVSKSHGNTNMLHLKRYIHRNSVPYLIIYSNDPQNIDIEELEQLSTKSATQLTLDQPKTLDTVIPGLIERSKRSLSDNSADHPIYQSRARSMSILTNEIPEDPEDYNRPYPIKVKENIQTHPDMLQTRKESRHKITDPRIIPYPGEYVEKRRKDKRKSKKRRKGKGRRKNKLELPRAWEDLRELAEEEVSDTSCSKKKLIVSFDEIGWGEWIISPKSFKSHYCSGTCSFPLTKKMRPSNHATIQSLVNAVGIYPDVPAPCCVPDKLSSITLLYFDEHRNVVLKNYPNMTVQKCACR